MAQYPLTPQQESALNLKLHTLVEAGAGTGKTRVLVLRYLAILRQNPRISPRQILALTFTEKAAQEMLERIETFLTETEPSSIEERHRFEDIKNQLHLAHIQTIHSFCAHLLRQYPVESNVDPTFRVIQEEVRTFYWQRAINDTLNTLLTEDPDSLIELLTHLPLSQLKKWLNSLCSNAHQIPTPEFRTEHLQNFIQSQPDVDPTDLESIALIETQIMGYLNQIYTTYTQWKHQTGSLDFDDLIIKTRQLLSKPGLCTIIQKQFPYILVDECQDTDTDQWTIIKALSAFDPHLGPKSNLFIVGDVKQSIYAFRGAEPQLFYEMAGWFQDHKTAQYIQLTHNFRSHPEIIEVANTTFSSLFTSSPSIDFTPLIAHPRTEKGSVQLSIYHNETEAIPDWIQSVSTEYPLSECALLTRTKRALEPLKTALEKAGIPATIRSGQQLKHHEEVTSSLSLIMMVLAPRNNILVLGVLRSMFFEVPEPLLLRIIQQKHQPSLITHILNLDIDTFIAQHAPDWTHASSTLHHTQALLKKWTQLIDWVPLDSLIETAFEDTRIILRLHLQSPNSQAITILKQFKKDILQFIRTHALTKSGLLNYLKTLIHQPIKLEQDLHTNSVQLLTIHASKGLEFSCVALPHLHKRFSKRPYSPYLWHPNYGLCLTKHPATPETPNPHYQHHHLHQLDKDREEEKRIFYVAITRAKYHLLLCTNPEPKQNDEIAHSHFDFLHQSGQAENLTPYKLNNTPTLPNTPTPTSSAPPPLPTQSDRTSLFTPPTFDTPPITIISTSQLIKTLTPTQKTPHPAPSSPPTIQPSSSAEQGTLIHIAIEQLCRTHDDIPKVLDRCLQQTHASSNRSKKIEQLTPLLHQFQHSDLYKAIQQAPQKWFEKAFTLKLPPTIIQGRIDIIYEAQDTIHIIDIKSDQTLKQNLPDTHPYTLQLHLYALAAKAMWPNRTITTALYFVRHNHLETVPCNDTTLHPFQTRLDGLVSETFQA